MLFGHYGPRQQGRLPPSTKHPPCLPAGLSLPGEGESEMRGENNILDKPETKQSLHDHKKQHTASQNSFHFSHCSANSMVFTVRQPPTHAEQCSHSLLSSNYCHFYFFKHIYWCYCMTKNSHSGNPRSVLPPNVIILQPPTAFYCSQSANYDWEIELMFVWYEAIKFTPHLYYS